MAQRTPCYYKTSFWVSFFFVVQAAMIIGQIFLGTATRIFGDEIFGTWLNQSLQLPLETMSYLYIAVVSAYIGVDRAAYTFKSSTLDYGTIDVGDPSTLRRVIIGTFITLLLAISGASVTEYDFSLNQYVTAFGVSITMYVAGQKACKFAKYSGDKNGDGIPDKYQTKEELKRKPQVVTRIEANGIENGNGTNDFGEKTVRDIEIERATDTVSDNFDTVKDLF